MKAVRERRVARFSISQRIIEEATPAALVILQGLLVVRAEALPYKLAVDYVAYGDQFEPLPDRYSEPPEYKPVIRDLVGGKYHVEWERV